MTDRKFGSTVCQETRRPRTNSKHLFIQNSNENMVLLALLTVVLTRCVLCRCFSINFKDDDDDDDNEAGRIRFDAGVVTE